MAELPPTYRVYCHDDLNKVVSADWVAASSDEEATSQIASKYSEYDCELWQDRRLVAQIGASRRSA